MDATSRITTSGGPKCPNHRVPLISIGEKNRGQCPISQCLFDYEAEDGEVTYDKYGRAMITYKMTGGGNG